MTKSTQWPCRGCGAPITGRGGKRYCGPECRPRCSINGCEKPRHGLTYCSMHHTRWKRHGDPIAPLTRKPNEGECSVEDCNEPMRKTRLCAGHYGMLRRYGEIRPYNYRWSPPGAACEVCGDPVHPGGASRRRVCSDACQQYKSRHPDGVPDPLCARCDSPIALMAGTKKRRRIRADVRLCKRCKTQSRTEAAPGELALRDGAFCQLCGCDVDLTATFPDPMRPSVDHIIPRAWGGSDAASNNQLSHLLCNQIKSDRHEGVSQRSTALGRAEGR